MLIMEVCIILCQHKVPFLKKVFLIL
jgi:hypothetical protein